MKTHAAEGIEVSAPLEGEGEHVLTSETLAFVGSLHRRFDGTRRDLLAGRAERQSRLDAGEMPDFLPETRDVRAGDWRVAPAPADLQDRRVEITGPVDRKMVINALNSGARVLHGGLRGRELAHVAQLHRGPGQPDGRDRADDRARHGREEVPPERRDGDADRPPARLAPVRAQRSRGRRAGLGVALRLRRLPAPNARRLLERGSGPYFYLPKLESHLEARLWADVFVTREASWGCLAARSRRPSSSRRSSPRSRWTRSSASCATTSPD